MTQNAIAELTALLGAAGNAHGVYETNELGGVYDQNWSEWYAAWLLEHNIGALLDTTPTVTELSAKLQACDAAYKQERPNESWPPFYARRLLGSD